MCRPLFRINTQNTPAFENAGYTNISSARQTIGIMHIREYTASDLESLRRLHSAQGMPYQFPDLTNPLFLTKLVIERDSSDADSREAGDIPIAGGSIVGAILLRLTSEAYFLLDPNAGTPRDRWQALLTLHEAARIDAARRGLDDAHAWLPPQVANAFGRRLSRLGWFREPWPSFSRSTGVATPSI
jgi:hypothetical protein